MTLAGWIEAADKAAEEKERFMLNLRIVDCETCRRRTVPDDRYPTGLCMAFNCPTAYAYERCLKCGSYERKGAAT
jgi:hypothetical protein